MTTPARIALAAGLFSVLAPAMAQTAAVPPVPPAPTSPSAAQPEIQYDTYFEPFDDNPVSRVRDITPLPPATPLFRDFDPLDGLDQYVKASRITLTNRAVFALPIMTVHVGQEFDVPFYKQSDAHISGENVWIRCPFNIARPLSAAPADWKDSTVVFNDKPNRASLENTFVIVQYTARSFRARGNMANIHFKALAPGECRLEVIDFDASDDVTYDHVLSLVRDGLITVLP
ncbi:MAG TPA: hypothetical protein VGM51_04160 [Armatimonadota bacterium]|jgi:hypothetical protein